MKVFSFNLIPEKSKEQVVKEQERDLSSIYTAILPLFAVLVWIGTLLFNGLVIEKTKAGWQKSIDTKAARIQSEFLPVIIQNGELVVKTKALTEVIIRDIKPENLFILTEALFPGEEQGLEINGYGRDSDGSFNINVLTEDYAKLAEVTRRLSNYQNVRNVTIKTAAVESDITDVSQSKIRGVISFFINEDFITTDGNATSTANN